MKKKLIFLCLCIFSITGCIDTLFEDTHKKPDPVLPPITSEGKNTFGCMVNGKLYLPNDYFNRFYYSWNDFPSLYGTLSLRANIDGVRSNNGFLIQLHNRVFTTGKHYVYSNPNTDNYLRHDINYDMDFYDYENYSVDSNNFIYLNRLDTINRIASGTFQFTLINNDNSKDTVKITEGRFDCKY